MGRVCLVKFHNVLYLWQTLRLVVSRQEKIKPDILLHVNTLDIPWGGTRRGLGHSEWPWKEGTLWLRKQNEIGCLAEATPSQSPGVPGKGAGCHLQCDSVWTRNTELGPNCCTCEQSCLEGDALSKPVLPLMCARSIPWHMRPCVPSVGPDIEEWITNPLLGRQREIPPFTLVGMGGGGERWWWRAGCFDLLRKSTGVIPWFTKHN